jgi:ankyrin repeat protein
MLPLDKKANIDADDRFGRTALQWAAEKGMKKW